MNTECLTLGPYETNCYLIEDNGKVLIIDPGSSPRRIIAAIGERKPCAILLTHGHFDHTGAVDRLHSEYKIPVYACRQDDALLHSDVLKGFNGESSVVKAPINWIEKNVLKIDGFIIKVFFVPGHSAGSLMFEINGQLFSGDTLFYEGVGRTDLYSGSYSQLKQSLLILYELPSDMIVYPGHGPRTTVGHELAFNLFL
ncbi:MAG: MBL fold metallo-hydrolase [Erysipelotrichaceae bacterium]|nr:MBL fold metallo-hydrolase [Erysipelotrichaceae bacterium]